MSKKVPVNIRDQCLLRYGQCLCDLCTRCSVVPMHSNTTFSSSSHIGVHSVENSWFHSNLCWAFSARCCNISKSLISAEYTKVFRCRGIMQAGRLGLHILPTVHQKTGLGAVWQCRENEGVPHHTWTICVVADEEANVPRVQVNHWPKTDSTLHLLVC
jgi:hypothetical protein